MNSIKELEKELEKASEIENKADRGVTIAAVIAEALRTVHQDPVLVGGAAVEFYTKGGYSTSDIDMVTEGGADLLRVMSELGFEKMGKDFSHPRLGIYIEFPGRSLQASERYAEIKIGKRKLRIVSIEDLIIDRLCSFKFWKSRIDGVNALLLLEMVETDPERLEKRAEEEDVKDAMKALLQVQEDAVRKKLAPEETNRLLEVKMKTFK